MLQDTVDTHMLYDFRCKRHGIYEVFRHMEDSGQPAYCPDCGLEAQRIFSSPAIKFVTASRLRYGSGSPGKMITGDQTGGLDIFIPSDGALEQEEVDYIAAGAIEKEKERVKKAKTQGARSEKQARIQAYASLARNAPRGQRAKAIKEAMKESGDRATDNKGQPI